MWLVPRCGHLRVWTKAKIPTCKPCYFSGDVTSNLPSISVLVGIGVEVTFEVIAAAALLRKLVPALRVRVVNVTDLMILSAEGSHPHALSHTDFETLFTKDRPIHFNFHGYPIELKGLLFGRPHLGRVSMEGYVLSRHVDFIWS